MGEGLEVESAVEAGCLVPSILDLGFAAGGDVEVSIEFLSFGVKACLVPFGFDALELV